MALTPRISDFSKLECFKHSSSETVRFLNRDHIISVTIRNGEIVVLTTAGTEITISASPETLAKFAEELAQDINSNFVSVNSPKFSIETPPHS